VDIKYYKDATEFLAGTGKYLARDEARYGDIIGTAHAVLRNPQLIRKEELWFCSINTGRNLNAAALSMMGRAVTMCHVSGDKETIAEKFVNAASATFPDIAAVRGEKELTDAFTGRWCDAHNVKISFTMEQRLYQLKKVNNLPGSFGSFRPASMTEKDLVLKWFHAFHMDVSGREEAGWEARILPAIERGWVHFWEIKGKPVTMATMTMPTDKGMSVGGVYTPPELRGKGYATTCVAELSRRILQSGKQFCILTTDLANPTSNSIYVKIGYKPVCDLVFHTFK
jgi:uncharacterized protein